MAYESVETRFDTIEQLISSMKRCSLIAGRRKVWDHLADQYVKTKGELLIMGEGADLSDKDVKNDFSRLDSSTRELLKSGKNMTRIQTVDTWIEWMKWLQILLMEFPTHFTLYFTSERLKFVPQLNIRDREEVIAVPPEESVDIAYAVKIYGRDVEATRAVQSCCSHFSRLLENSVRLRTPTQVDRLRQSLEAVKNIQTDLLIVCEFQTQKRSEKKVFDKPRHRTVQQYFTLDHNVYRKISRKDLRPRYNSFYGPKSKTLGHALCSIFPERYQQTSNYETIGEQIVQNIPLGTEIIDPRLIAVFLDNDHIRGSALDMSHCLTNSLFRIAQKISKR